MKKKSKDLSIFDKDLVVDGQIDARGELIIRGRMTGILKAENVVIAEEGNVYGEAVVLRMTIGGKFEGHVVASEELIVLSTGRCLGQIVCKNIIVEAGGSLNARVSNILSQTSAEDADNREVDTS